MRQFALERASHFRPDPAPAPSRREAGGRSRGRNHIGNVMTAARVATHPVAMASETERAGRDAQAAHRLAGGGRFAAAVYGSFLAASVIGVAYQTGEDAREMTETLLGTMVIFWLAHAWSEVVGEHIAAASRLRPGDVLRVARGEWPLVEAAVVPTLLLGLAWAGAWSRDTGAMLAFSSAIVQITGWGFLAGLRSGATLLCAALLGAVQGTLGLALLALKALVG
jgi:hypothetical protein